MPLGLAPTEAVVRSAAARALGTPSSSVSAGQCLKPCATARPQPGTRSSSPVGEAGGGAGVFGRVFVCVCPQQSEEMHEGGGLGRCQAGVVGRRGECGPEERCPGQRWRVKEVGLATRRPRIPRAGRRVYPVRSLSGNTSKVGSPGSRV